MRVQYSAEQKVELVRKVNAQIKFKGWTIKKACEKFGLPRPNYYKWSSALKSAEGSSEDGLTKSRRPNALARETPKEICDKIADMANSGLYKSANQISKKLSLERPIKTETVIKILERLGLYGFIVSRDENGKYLSKKKGFIKK